MKGIVKLINLCSNGLVKSWARSLYKSLHAHFIPSHINAYQPHFLRAKVAALVLGLVLGVEALYLTHTLFIIPNSNYFAAIFTSVIFDQTNENRQIQNLSSLSANILLEQAAQKKANDMAEKGYFAHNSPDGKTPWYWFQDVGYDYAAAGENLAVNFTDSKDVTEAWMRSPTHRANILNNNYTEIGIATAHGKYKGKEAIFVVQEFGRPSIVAREINIVNDATAMVDQAGAVASSNVKAVGVMLGNTTKKPEVTVSKPKPTSTPVIGKTAPTPVITPTTTVAGAQTTKLDTTVYPLSLPILESAHRNKLDLLLASPRQTTTTVYLILAAILLTALALVVFIKIRIQYPHIIANGILLFALTLSLLLLNAALGFTQGVI